MSTDYDRLMRNLSRFHKQRALLDAGLVVSPYPAKPDGDGEGEQLDAIRQWLAACDHWEDDLDARYLQLLRDLPPFQPDSDVQAFIERCEKFGLTGGLVGLNGRVTHRYTGLYKFNGDRMLNVELVDKAREPLPAFLAEVPLGDSFCQFVLREGSFQTCDSARDDRLNGHPYKGVMVSYHGVPVINHEGALFGSLCHFDVTERQINEAEFAHMQGVARAIAPYLGTGSI